MTSDFNVIKVYQNLVENSIEDINDISNLNLRFIVYFEIQKIVLTIISTISYFDCQFTIINVKRLTTWLVRCVQHTKCL